MAQSERSSRWITIRTPFDYTWPSRAITAYTEPGDILVKEEVADFAVEKGYATEGKVDGSAKSRKGGKRNIARRHKKQEAATAKAANRRSVAPVGSADVPAADSSGSGSGVDPASG